MTISSNNRKAGPFIGNGSAATFPFTFKVFQASDLFVVRLTVSTGAQSTLVLGTDYTVTLNLEQDSNPGGSITLVAGALASGYNLIITSDIGNLQPTDLTNQGGFYPEVINDSLDRATIQIQQLQEQTDRTLKYPVTDPSTGTELPAVAQRAGKVLTFDELGAPIAGPSVDEVGTILDNLANITTVANDLNGPDTIGTVATNIADVNTVASNMADVNTVADNIADVGTVATNIADVIIAADNVADINNFADVYQGAKASDPTLRNNGSPLQPGDMYFNTSVNELRLYSGSVWVAGTAGTVAVQRFNGTGSQTAFSLSTAPSGENNTQVYINGVYQQKDTYSVTGVTLTFSTAPPAGTENIEVVTISTLALGETDASLVTFLPAGAGAVERTAQSKLRDFVSVLDFGAYPDGTNAAATTLAFKNAIAYCQDNLKTLYIPSNNPSQVYLLNETLVISKPLRVIGDGARNVTLAGTGLAAGAYLIDIDGTAFGTYEQGEFRGFTMMPGTGVNCMRVKNVSNSMFSDLGLRNCTHGIVYTGTRCFSNIFEKIKTITALAGTAFWMNEHTGGGQHSFRECSFGGNTGFSLSSTTATDSVAFYNTNFEQCSVNSVSVTGSVGGLSFFGCRTEGCDGGADFAINPTAGNSVYGLVVSGCNFSADAGAARPIALGGSGGLVRGFSITGNSGGYIGNPNFVFLNGEGESGIIAGNRTIYSSAIVNAKRSGVVVFGNEYNGTKNDESWGAIPWAVTNANWTPIDASGAGLTLTAAGGTYQRIGNMIFFHADIVYPTTSNTAIAIIGGLPANIFDGVASSGRAGATINVTDSTATGALLLTNTNTIRIQNGGFTNATNANLSGKTLYISGMYRIG